METTENSPIQRPQVLVKLDNFEGSLDLLIALIEKNEMDIYSVSLTKLTADYLEYIHQAQQLNLSIAGEYLVLAANLLLMKSRSLLPTQEIEEEKLSEEEEAELLMQRLAEYEQFRAVAEDLKERAQVRQKMFTRTPPPFEPEEGEVTEYIEIDLYALASAFKKIITEVDLAKPLVISAEEYTIDEKMQEIEDLGIEHHTFSLDWYLSSTNSKLEVVVIFMALLESIRLKIVEVKQSTKDNTIWIIFIQPRSEVLAQMQESMEEEDFPSEPNTEGKIEQDNNL